MVSDEETKPVPPTEEVSEQTHPDQVLTAEVREYRAQLQARFWLWAPCMAIGFIASGMDESIQTAANAPIGAEFNALDRVSWLGTGWFVGVITGYPLWCILCDIVGRKAPIVLYHASYVLGLFLSGFARSLPMLIVGRAFQGLGAAGCVCLVSIIIADTFELQRRGYFEAGGSIIFCVCSSAGPIVGAACTRRGWRWVYLIQLPCAFIGLVGTLLGLPNTHVHSQPDPWAALRKHNLAGLVSAVGGTIALYTAFDQASTHGWHYPAVYGILAGALLLYVTFAFTEWRHPEPYIPRLVVHSRSLLSVCLLNFLVLSAGLSVLYYLPLYWQVSRGFSILTSGLLTLPASVSGAVAGFIGTFWFWRFQEFKYLLVLGNVVGLLGAAGLVLFPHLLKQGLVPGVSVAIFCTMMGAGWLMVAATMALNTYVPASNTAPAFRAMFLFRGIGTGLGISILSLIVQVSLRARLHRLGLSNEDIDRVRESLNNIGRDGKEILVRAAYGLAIADSFVWVLVVFVLSVPPVLLMKGKSLIRNE